jgi:1-aminocyclopropane-1-carboxylate deaminase/D-cysteine desulfhydrase-like pyridoxal-dependent ACC family enzyme
MAAINRGSSFKMIEIGGAASNSTVQNIVAYATRSWSTIQIFEGMVISNVPQCQNANISNNVIGPAETPDGKIHRQWRREPR